MEMMMQRMPDALDDERHPVNVLFADIMTVARKAWPDMASTLDLIISKPSTDDAPPYMAILCAHHDPRGRAASRGDAVDVTLLWQSRKRSTRLNAMREVLQHVRKHARIRAWSEDVAHALAEDNDDDDDDECEV